MQFKVHSVSPVGLYFVRYLVNKIFPVYVIGAFYLNANTGYNFKIRLYCRAHGDGLPVLFVYSGAGLDLRIR